ncbi:hypothetical protein ACFFRR_000353 [Megaselia abdita]
MLIKLNTSNSSFSELSARLQDFAAKKKQYFKTKLNNFKYLEKSKNFFKFVYTKTFKRAKFKYEKLSKMTIVELNMLEIREANPDIDNIIRSIILSRTQTGATIEEIRGDYYDLVGESLPHMVNAVEFVLSIPNIVCHTDMKGTKIFHAVPTEKNQHLFEMIVNQKPPREKPRIRKTRGFFGNNHEERGYYKANITSYRSGGNYASGDNYQRNPPVIRPTSSKLSLNSHQSEGFFGSRENFYEDNFKYLQSRFTGEYQPPTAVQYLNEKRPQFGSSSSGFHQSVSSLNSSDESRKRRMSENLLFQKQNGYLMERFQMIGDDFLLYLAKMELGCKFTPRKKVYQSGLCVSGQTISDARLRVSTAETLAPYVIINIGSVDILNGKPLVRMENEAIRLTEAIRARNSVPIWTSLTPLANYNHQPLIVNKVKKFNEFLERTMNENHYIDISGRVKNTNGKTLYDCYQPAPRIVSGSKHPHLFWNKIGRQRILKHIEDCIEIA